MRRKYFAFGVLAVGLIPISGCSSSKPPASDFISKPPTSDFIKSDVIEDYYGFYQLEVKVVDGKVAKVNILKTPDGESQIYSDFSIPELIKNSIGVTNSSEVQSVSGASYTSDGYRKSLQSALDKQ